MGTVTNSMIDGTGRGLQDVTVRISLIAPLNPFLLNGTGEVIQRYAVDTDHDGVWSATILPNSSYENQDTYYLVDETEAPDGHLWTILMPDGTATHMLRDLLIDAPPSGSGSPIFHYSLEDLTDVHGVAQPGDVLTRTSNGDWEPVAPAILPAEFYQPTPLATWTWQHNMGRYPLINVLDGQRNAVLVAYRHLDLNSLQVYWGAPTTGYIEAR